MIESRRPAGLFKTAALSLTFIVASVAIFAGIGYYNPRKFGFYSWKTLFTSKQFLQSLTVVVTNGFIAPLIIECYHAEHYTEVVIGFMTFLTSVCYHVCEALRMRIWDMNDGNWHRLDNVFIVLSAQNLLYYIFFALEARDTAIWDNPEEMKNHEKEHLEHFKKEERVHNLFRWVGLAFCLTCQEKAPWKIFYTILPIALPGACAMLRMVILVPRQYKPRYNWRAMFTAMALLGIGVIFFVFGLDEKKDYLRIYHGLWHVFGAFGFYAFFHCKNPSSERVLTKDNLKQE
ncbi:CA4 [Acrasis kona]|uniref:CA4 n=1 Tax=Acrasis kona TaxID=1008807 RepID=A0AAW2ZLQ6_9EUKA